MIDKKLLLELHWKNTLLWGGFYVLCSVPIFYTHVVWAGWVSFFFVLTAIMALIISYEHGVEVLPFDANVGVAERDYKRYSNCVYISRALLIISIIFAIISIVIINNMNGENNKKSVQLELYSNNKKEHVVFDSFESRLRAMRDMVAVEVFKNKGGTLITSEGPLGVTLTHKSASMAEWKQLEQLCALNDAQYGHKPVAFRFSADSVNPVFVHIIRNRKKFSLIMGGSRSGKTYAMAQIAVQWLLSGDLGDEHTDSGFFDIVREELTVLKATVVNDIDSVLAGIPNNGVEKLKSPLQYSYGGRVIRLYSTTEDKAKGASRTYLWANEADTVKWSSIQQLLLRGVKRAFFDYNPVNPNSWVVTHFEKEGGAYQKDSIKLHSTYRDNYFLPQYVIDEVERMADLDPYMRNVFRDGVYSIKEGVVLPPVTIIDDLQDVGELLGGEYYHLFGLDFGVSSPSACVSVFMPKDIKSRELYVEEVFYKANMSPEDMITEIDRYKQSRGITEGYIIADGGGMGKQMIDELYVRGLKVSGAKKGKIEDGVGKLKMRKIITNKSSVNFINETRLYSYVHNTDGTIGTKLEDDNNHAIDAVRYAMTQL